MKSNYDKTHKTSRESMIDLLKTTEKTILSYHKTCFRPVCLRFVIILYYLCSHAVSTAAGRKPGRADRQSILK